MAKYTRLRERIAHSDLAKTCQLLIPPAATDQQLLLVHSADYVEAVKRGRLTALQQRRIGFPWSAKMVERSRRSTGASIAAAISALEDGLSANLAGGTHHSFADSGQGYCVFNDVCVAARTMQHHRRVKRVLVVDCDVHQGNGTAAITRQDDSIFAFSMHCETNYPFQKTEGDLDIALPPKTGDEAYLAALKFGLNKSLEKIEPELVFFLAGADPFEQDRLGQLSLTKSGLRRRDEYVINFFRDQDIAVSIAMAGGYAPDLDDIVDIHFATIETATHRFLRDRVGIQQN